MMDDFGVGAQGDATHNTVDHTTDNPPYGPSPTDEPQDLLDLLADFDGGATTDQNDAPTLSPAEEFEDFHSRNPAVYAALCHLSRRWKRIKGDQHIGFPAIWETARYEIGLATTGDPYQLNNNARAFYSRLLMYREPDLAGMFEIRRSPAADTWITELATREGRLDELPQLMGWVSA